MTYMILCLVFLNNLTAIYIVKDTCVVSLFALNIWATK